MININFINSGLSKQQLQAAALYNAAFHPAVSTQHKAIYKVITASGEIQAEVSGKLSYQAGEAGDYPVVGDWVLVDRLDDAGGNAIIHGILPRTSCLERKAAGTAQERQIVAANIDTVFICTSLNNDFNLRRIERYLSIVWESGAAPVIVLTKSDLCPDIDEKLAEVATVAIGVDILVTSSLSTDGYTAVLPYLQPGRTIAFIGSSGVGKSTLINRLLGEERLVTKEVRADDDRGRHATTHRQLILLPSGGIVLDTPGMREIQIAGADLSVSFADIEELAAFCRFRDCRHGAEPGCAVRQAIEDGSLSAARFENYKKLQQEMLFLERKGSMTAAQAEREKTKEMMGSLRAYKQMVKEQGKKR
jgi:ribosome biogenesis GTPase